MFNTNLGNSSSIVSKPITSTSSSGRTLTSSRPFYLTAIKTQGNGTHYVSQYSLDTKVGSGVASAYKVRRPCLHQDIFIFSQDSSLLHILVYFINLLAIVPGISHISLMHITRSRKLIDTNYVISGQPLEAVKCYKYLGFILSCDLSWTSHVRSIVAKCSKLSGFIR